MIRDSAGSLYGTTSDGGGSCSCGIVFKIAPDGTEAVLHDFGGEEDGDGGDPRAGLIEDKAGTLYGTTSGGGGGNGTIFKLAPVGTETVLYAFRGGDRDGAFPFSGLIRDKAGNLYGTTSGGGGGCRGGGRGCGTIFKLAPDGTETVLFAFARHRHRGAWPYAGLTKGGGGQLYGTAEVGGKYRSGTVFRLQK